MFQRLLGKAAKIYLMKKGSWNLINEENLVFSRAKDRMRPNAGARVWEAARIGPGAAHIGVYCCLWLIGWYLLSAAIQLFPRLRMIPKVGPLGVGAALQGTGEMGWRTGHISRADPIRASDSPLLFVAHSVHVCLSPGWLIQSSLTPFRKGLVTI